MQKLDVEDSSRLPSQTRLVEADVDGRFINSLALPVVVAAFGVALHKRTQEKLRQTENHTQQACVPILVV